VTILGWIGTILMGCVALPQIVRNYRRKQVADLSLWYFVLLANSCSFLLLDLFVGTWQPTAAACLSVSLFVTMIIIGQILYYRKAD